jgi:hypothetical protein
MAAMILKIMATITTKKLKKENSMNFLTVALMLILQAQANEESPRAFLESKSFDQICAQTVVAKPPFESLGTTWKNFFLLKRPSFTEGNGFVYVGVGSTSDKYKIFRINKSEPAVIEEFYQTSGVVKDILWSQNSLWILKNRSISKLDLNNKNLDSLVLSTQQLSHELDHAYDMATIGNELYISHGTQGIIVINKESFVVERKINLGLLQSNGHKSIASPIAVIDSNRLIIGADNLTIPQPESKPFNGLIELNVKTNSIRKYPYKTGTLSANSKFFIENKTLWINNWGTIQFLPIDSLAHEKAVYTNYIPTVFFQNEKKWSAEPLGEFFVLGNDIFACAKRSQLMTSQPEPKIGMAYRVSSDPQSVKIEFKKYDLEIKTKWVVGPYATDFKKSTLQVEIFNSKGALVSLPKGTSLGFYATMPSMDHPAVDMGYFDEDSKGIYVNKEIILGMTGDWSLSLYLYNKNFEELDKVVFNNFL